MYYIYFLFVSALFFVLLWDCGKVGVSRWWALFVLAAPVVLPYYLFCTRPKNWTLPALVFAGLFIAVVAGEALMIQMGPRHDRESDCSPGVLMMIKSCDALKKAAVDLDNGIQKIVGQSQVAARRTDIATTISALGDLKLLLFRYRAALENLQDILKNDEQILSREELRQIEIYYNSPIVAQYIKSLEAYVNDFESLLQYVFKNFDNIEARRSKYLQNYDAYYINYRRSLERHNKMAIKRMEYQNALIRANPEIAAYLPRIRHTGYLRLWEY